MSLARPKRLPDLAKLTTCLLARPDFLFLFAPMQPYDSAGADDDIWAPEWNIITLVVVCPIWASNSEAQLASEGLGVAFAANEDHLQR